MRVVLAVENTSLAHQLRRVLVGEGLACEAADVVAYDDLPSRLAAAEADLVVVDCRGDRESALEAIRGGHQVSGAPILACGPAGDSELVRLAVRNGCREYLDSAQLREEFCAALAQLQSQGRLPDDRGTVVAIYSPSGGVGVTTAAVNLASRLADLHPGEVALVDLKPAPSDLALMLDITPTHTTSQVLRDWQRLDRQMLAGAMTEHGSGMQVLPQESYDDHNASEDVVPADRRAVRQLLSLLRRAYRVSVLDLDTSLGDAQIEAMKLSTCVALLVRPDVPGIRRARWALDAAARRGVARERFRLVVSRAGVRRQVPPAKCAENLGIPLLQTIPDDGSAMNHAVNHGLPLSESSKLSRINRSFTTFAKSIESMRGSQTV